jgi:hypothetical protein
MAGQLRIALTMREIRTMPADEIIDDADFKTAIQKQINHVAADEPGATGHHRTRHDQAAFIFLSVRTL